MILTVLPSGADTNVSCRMVRPADGAMASLSIISAKALKAPKRASASGLLYSATSSSREVTSVVGGISGMAPKTAFRRGSIRGSSLIFEAMGGVR